MATTPSDANVAAKLIERLLADPDFRMRFRRDPAGACREAGLEQLARDMSRSGGNAMNTLEGRISVSSLAGVMMAAAMEGVGIYEITNLGSHLPDVANVLSRVDLPAIGHHHKSGGGAAALGGNGAPADAPSSGGGAVDAPAGGGGSAGALPTDAPAGAETANGAGADATSGAAPDGNGSAGAAADAATSKSSKQSSVVRRAARKLAEA